MIKITGKTRIYGIIGHPVAHSFSPPMQNAAFEAIQENAVYVPFDIHPDQLGIALSGIRHMGISGLNVTVPHKSAVLEHLDHLTDTAKRIGAVNTIRIDEQGMTGTNTDGSGFVRSLEEIDFQPAGKTIGILGAGGAARGILVALTEAGADKILIQNRTAEKAETLAKEFAAVFPEQSIQSLQKQELESEPLDLLINTTSAGMHDDTAPVDLSQFRKVANVADIIYNPAETPLLRQAKGLNIPCINGLGMLLYQGCDAFEFWTGQKAPVPVMKKHLLEQLSS